MTTTLLEPPDLQIPARVPGDLVVAIVLGDCHRMETELARIPAPLRLLKACGRLAAANGQLEALQQLLRIGFPAADAEAMKCAAAAGWTSIVQELQVNGAKLEPAADLIRAAARGGHLELLKYIHGQGYSLAPCADLVDELVRRRSREPVLAYLRANGICAQATTAGDSANSRPCLSRETFKPAASSPGISLILVNYNDSVYLRTSLEALLGQTRLPDEIIIVDDGSTDDSVDVIQRFMALCPRARLLRQERNFGQHAAVQRALAAATCEYVVWTAADDLLLPHFIEKATQALSEHPGIGLCFSRLCAWREGTRFVRKFTRASHGDAFYLGKEVRAYSASDLRQVLKHTYLWISGNTVVARRDALVAMGGFESSLRWHADWFAYYAIALRHGACAIPETLAMMRERQDSFSRVGMHDYQAQQSVLRSVIDVINSPGNEDLRDVFSSCPSLFSPFGKRMLAANVFRPNAWGLLAPYFFWLLPRKAVAMIGTGRAVLSHALNKALGVVGNVLPNRHIRSGIVRVLRWRRGRRRRHLLALRAAAEEEN